MTTTLYHKLHTKLLKVFGKKFKNPNPIKVNPEEKKILNNALTLKNTLVEDIMTPRSDIIWVPHNLNYDGVIAHIQPSPHSRFPVCAGKLDKVQGYIGLKEILTLASDKKNFNLKKNLRAPLFVPTTMKCLNLLLKMRQERSFYAIVIDEYGCVDGLVTLTDIVENIVGDVDEPEEAAQEAVLIEHPDGTLTADGRVELKDLKEKGYNLQHQVDLNQKAETIGGLILDLIDHVPTKGEIIKHPNGFTLEILDATPRTIKRLKIYPPQAAPKEPLS